MAPCSGLRVLELSRGLAGSLATMVLADFGADVVRVEPPGGDPLWDEPVALVVHRGKESISADLATESGRDEIRHLARAADVVVEGLRPGEADELAFEAERLTRENPGLVYCSISSFGHAGPLAQVAGNDALVMAKAGIFRDQPGRHRAGGRPVFRNTREPSFAAGMLAVEGIVSALRAREITGAGQVVATSLLEALTWRLNPFVRWLLPDGEDPSLDGGYGIAVPSGPTPRGAELTGQMLETKDGRWIVHMLFERDFFSNWVGVLGLDWIWDDERFKAAPHGISDPAAREDLAALFEERMKQRTAAEWMELYVANGNVCADVVETTHEALRHPQAIAGDYLVDVDDPRVGKIVQVGPLAKIPGAPPRCGGRRHIPAPPPQQTWEPRGWTHRSPPRHPPAPTSVRVGPWPESPSSRAQSSTPPAPVARSWPTSVHA